MHPQSTPPAWIELLGKLALLTALAFIAVLHIVLFFHAGPLWRDEANSAAFAAMPSVSAIASTVGLDPHPIGFSLILRAWSHIAATDQGMRLLGLITGLGILAALWLTSRMLGAGAPLAGLVLFGLNSTAIVYGDSVRPYGVAILFIVLAAGFVWRATRINSTLILAAALACALVSVHCLYQSSVFVFAICIAGAATALWQRNWRAAGSILAVGLMCAISLLPSIGNIRQIRDWSVVWQAPAGFGQLSRVIFESLGESGILFATIWIALIVLAGVLISLRWISTGDVPKELLFPVLTLALSVAGLLAFVKFLGAPSQPWYYLSLIALATVCMDGIFSIVSNRWLAPLLRLVVIPAVIAIAGSSLWEAVHVRATNMDAIASQLAAKASPDDFIVINPWYLGVSFHHAYHGATPWVTVPPVHDHRIHRYDLFKQAMASENPLQPVLAGMQKSLGSGKRVWLIGDLMLPSMGTIVPTPPPAPTGPDGWSSGPYAYAWTMQVGRLLNSHALRAEQVALPVDAPVSRFENPPLFVFEGWQP